MEERLVLKEKMGRSWLIQRLEKPYGTINPWSFGGGLVNGGLNKKAMEILKNLYSFDYMGSSEFEWGAVPAAFNFLAEQSTNHNLISGQISNVFYICPKNYEEGVKKVISDLLEDENKNFRLKEFCGLKNRVENPNEYNERKVGWLELDNGFMFFVDEEMFKNSKTLFEIS